MVGLKVLCGEVTGAPVFKVWVDARAAGGRGGWDARAA